MYTGQELLSYAEVVERLEEEGLKKGTKAFREGAQRFAPADMSDKDGKPLYVEIDFDCSSKKAKAT